MTAPARKAYRFFTGKDEAAFCQRVSDALAEGYSLYGNPVMVMDDGERIVGQAVIDREQVGSAQVEVAADDRRGES